MHARIAMIAAILGFLPVVLLQGQTSDTSAQARSVLVQALNVSGYSGNPIPGFTASGTMTFFGGLSKQVGPVAIKARGHDQFRIDATLPNGVRTVSFDRSGGKRKEPNGRTTDLPAHNTLVAINPVLPYMELANALSKPEFNVSYQGLTTEGTRQLHRVRLRAHHQQSSRPFRTVRRPHPSRLLHRFSDKTSCTYRVDCYSHEQHERTLPTTAGAGRLRCERRAGRPLDGASFDCRGACLGGAD